jgi:hypothetical protein
MKWIHNYKSDSIYTFETGIIGKEELFVLKDSNNIVIPGFQLGFQFDDEIKYFEKSYLVFRNVNFFKNTISFFSNKDITNSCDYKIEFSLYLTKIKIELESICYRDNTESFSSILVNCESLDILYNNEINYDILTNFNEVISNKILKPFLLLNEYINDIENIENTIA